MRASVERFRNATIIAPGPHRIPLFIGDSLRFARWLATALFVVTFCAAAADPGKVLHAAFTIAETSFDPVLGWDAAPIAGLQVVDRYTLRIRLTHPDYTFAYLLAMPATAAVARETVEAYGTDLGAHPVGTGPYLLREYQRSSRIVLEANPGFRKLIFD